eukprot:scaffold805_cov110-Isochrysis_galbana.AAC.4
MAPRQLRLELWATYLICMLIMATCPYSHTRSHIGVRTRHPGRLPPAPAGLILTPLTGTHPNN